MRYIHPSSATKVQVPATGRSIRNGLFVGRYSFGIRIALHIVTPPPFECRYVGAKPPWRIAATMVAQPFVATLFVGAMGAQVIRVL
jgi:hypothetical protein